MSSSDKDYRYMATSDLLHLLEQDQQQVDAELEERITTSVLRNLEDVSGDIAGMAVKW